jgi:hypothetical protein
MRYYGTPTRLTDFTRSLFIAAYFALEDAAGESVVWAVSKTWLTTATREAISEIGDEASRRLGQSRGERLRPDIFQTNTQTFRCGGLASQDA